MLFALSVPGKAAALTLIAALRASQMRYSTNGCTLALTARLRKTERQARTGMRSFDDLVGAGEDRGRDRQPEGLGGVEIDNQLEGGRLLDGRSAGLAPAEDLSGKNPDLAAPTTSAPACSSTGRRRRRRSRFRCLPLG
jgi:hypothetical protein